MSLLPEQTRKRLLLLREFLETFEKAKITSKEISELLGCKDTLVRWDFRFLNLERGVKNGYQVQKLLESIKNALLIQSDEQYKKICIVGLGRLGAALLDDEIFEKSGFKVCAGFDSSLNRVELLRSTFELYPASRIETVLPQEKIEYAVLCCPECEAEKMVGRLVNAGIKGIVNYTRAVLKVPPSVKVENVSPVLALQMCVSPLAGSDK